MEKQAIVKIHPRTFSEEDLIINLDFFGKPKLQPADIIEVSNQDDGSKSLCLQVKDLPLDLQPKGGTVTVSQAVAQALGISGMTNRIVRKVEMQNVTIGLTEVIVKNQYIGRSDMWRLTNSLMDTCVYVGKTIEFAGIRVQVDKLWRQGEIVSSGAVASDSRVVFRSASAHMYLFIQVSAEITDFDSHGDQYFDKAMNGFMKELFGKIKENDCSHLATIVLFSRTYYYSAKYRSDFPANMRENILKDIKGNYYEDFYDVIGEIRTGSDMEWDQILVKAKRSFMTHASKTNCCHEDSRIPVGTLSKSFQGNFLECINLTLNASATNYVDLDLTMTAHSILIVTPGVGVFEVDRELYTLTNSRVSDLGSSVDVICLTEQPFHAIPLLMLRSKSSTSDKDDYSIPDWMNYSFYNPLSSWSKGQFEPRIKLSDHLINKYLNNQAPPTPLCITPQASCIRSGRRGSKASITDQRLLQRTDYDDYDEQIFQKRILVHHSISGVQHGLYRHKSDEELRVNHMVAFDEETLSGDDNTFSQDSNSDASVVLQTSKMGQTVELTTFTGSLNNNGETPRGRFLSTGSSFHYGVSPGDKEAEGKDKLGHRPISSVEVSRSAYYSPQHSRKYTQRRKPIFNPFNPNEFHQVVTANTRRWMHVFPRRSDGHAFQPHHDVPKISVSKSSNDLMQLQSSDKGTMEDSPVQLSDRKPDVKQQSRLFGRIRSSEGGCQPTAAENFSTTRRKGTDWESVIKPACLPVTTDYFPSQKELEQKFREYNYNLSQEGNVGVTDDMSNSPWSSPRKYMGPIESLKEVISQRILRGFQLVLHEDDRYQDLYHLHNELVRFSKSIPSEDTSFKVTLGRVHHRIVMTYPDIKIIMYNPADKYKHHPSQSVHKYRYQLCPAGQEKYQPRNLEFSHEGAENFNWNYVDQHVLGYQEFAELPETSRYQKFRCRYLLLPTEALSYGKPDTRVPQQQVQLISGFVRLMDFLNHIKRHSTMQRQKHSVASTPSRSSSTASRGSASSGVLSPVVIFPRNSSQPLDIGGNNITSRRVSIPYSVGKQQKLSLDENSQLTKDPNIISPENRHPTSKSLRQNIDVAELVKYKPPKSHHLRRKSETDFDKDNTIDSYRGSMEELTEDKSKERPKSMDCDKQDDPPSGGSTSGGKQRVKRNQSSMTLMTKHPSITTTPPTPRRKGMRAHQSVDIVDHSADKTTIKMLSPVQSGPSFTTTSSPLSIIAGLTDELTGLEFVISHVVGLQCFIAMEMVDWLLEYVDGIESRQQAVKFAQVMLDSRLIRHASGDLSVPFKDGYHMYKIVKNDTSSDDKTFCVIDSRGDQFKTHWFEVSLSQPSPTDSRLESRTTTPSSMSSATSSPRGDSSLPYYMLGNSLEEDNFEDETMAPERSFVELTPDPQKVSDRPEWCFIYYDSTYHPSRTFQFEFQWVVSTAALISQLAQSWSRKAHMCGFNLVRVPLSSSFSGEGGNHTDPFRNPHHIPLCMTSDDCFAAAKKKIFVSAIAEKFGFILDSERNGQEDLTSSSPSNPQHTIYVHYTGCFLIKPQWKQYNNSENLWTGTTVSWAESSVSWTESEINIQSPTKIVPHTQVGTAMSVDDIGQSDSSAVCGFWWYDNHFADTVAAANSRDLLNQFQTFCQDQDNELQKFCSQFVH